MFNRAELKACARETIKGKWFIVFLVSLLVGVIASGPPQLLSYLFSPRVTLNFTDLNSYSSMTTPTYGAGSILAALLGIAYSIVVGIPLGTSLVGYRLKVSRHQEATLGDALSGFSHFVPFIKASLWVALWSIIWMLPFAVLYTVGFVLAESGMAFGWVLVVLGIAAYIFAIPRILLYSMATYAIADDPNLSAKQALDYSKRLMMGHRAEYFIFSLSFFPWMLLVLVTCGIASIYVVPYVSIADAMYFDYLNGRGYSSGAYAPNTGTNGGYPNRSDGYGNDSQLPPAY